MRRISAPTWSPKKLSSKPMPTITASLMLPGTSFRTILRACMTASRVTKTDATAQAAKALSLLRPLSWI
eukprot:scaffold337212_cov43-Prasinocladus_malaysianus.AAC.1